MNWRAGERSFNLNIPVVGAKEGLGEDEPFTHVQIFLSYADGRGYFYANIKGVRVKDRCESWIMFGGSKTLKLDSGHKRYNAKQLEAWRTVLTAAVCERKGLYWDEIAAVVAAMGGEVVDWNEAGA